MEIVQLVAGEKAQERNSTDPHSRNLSVRRLPGWFHRQFGTAFGLSSFIHRCWPAPVYYLHPAHHALSMVHTYDR